MYNTDIPNREELPSTAKLIRSTIIAAIVALVLLVTVVMPAEYALDPTGAGRLLGLTEMGEIKEQLAEEAAADEAAQMVAVNSSADQTAPEVSEPVMAEAVEEIRQYNSQIATAAEQQTSVAEDINQNVTLIRDVGEQSATSTEQVSAASEELARLAEGLSTQVAQFRV